PRMAPASGGGQAERAAKDLALGPGCLGAGAGARSPAPLVVAGLEIACGRGRAIGGRRPRSGAQADRQTGEWRARGGHTWDLTRLRAVGAASEPARAMTGSDASVDLISF